MKPRLTWSNEPHETGLSRVCEAPRGRILKVDGDPVANVDAYCIGVHKYSGWYWYAGHCRLGIVSHNDYEHVFETKGEAVESCEKYVREQLGMK